MSIFAIGDLHLSFGNNKPMDVFGVNWENHYIKIQENWKRKITNNDLVLLVGDFSWATYLQDTIDDFTYLNNLPGKKILLKGNHDYWWETTTKMKAFLKENSFENIDFLFNNCIEYNGYSICGTRGWGKTNDDKYDDDKILKRECQRLEYSLKQAKTENIIVILHFPPTNEEIQLMNKYNAKKCIYGHLHGQSHTAAIIGNVDSIEYYLVSSDYTEFDLIKIE